MRASSAARLIVPIYINEKIVLDMLAIMEDGFSMISQVSYSEQKDSASNKSAEAGVSTSATLLSKLLKINLSGKADHSNNNSESRKEETEKIHTNVSLLSKFRSYLIEADALKQEFKMDAITVGDFIEIEGELQKNPLIDYLDHFVDVFRMIGIFSPDAQLGNKTQARAKSQENNKTVEQIKSFSNELKQSGTVDFIISNMNGNANGTVVLSAQEQYLENDNISEILGGSFKVLGKVIAVYKDESQKIDLLRKTSLSLLPNDQLKSAFSTLNTEEFQKFNFPEFKTEIAGPALIIIPIAIYA